MLIQLYNSLSKSKESFTPLIPDKVGLYVCGPTVYDYPHLGNARSVVVYDILYRLLCEYYGNTNVTYVRNITDVDDKIITSARNQNSSIQDVTTKFTKIFHEDIDALNCLSPSIEPKATEHIEEMIYLIQSLIERSHAYISNSHVYFDITSFADYCNLSGRTIEEMIPGSRINIDPSKKHPGDFVLWKPADHEDDSSSIFQSPWGEGRPGWHIECSAMSIKYLGPNFDIHGGGSDLIFPHHTNEIAQSCCSGDKINFAKYWVHNGFLTVNGEKMSKSLGNFTTVRDLLNKGIKGEVIRYLLLATHYRKPLDFNEKSLGDAQKAMDSFYRAILKDSTTNNSSNIDNSLYTAICDDLNTPEAISVLHSLVRDINKEMIEERKLQLIQILKKSANFIGLLTSTPEQWFHDISNDQQMIEQKILERTKAKLEKNWELADQIRNHLQEQGILLEDTSSGKTLWRKI
ncbi:Cysteine--tRNA ligase [Rickettsiales bacterium Ac37b]|nr:Cysteine--tRNA ligase [Rickettsiales bacterium Ac37b]